MKKTLFFVFLACSFIIQSHANNLPKHLTITEIANPNNKKDKVLIIESQDPEALAVFDKVMAQYPELKQIKSNETNGLKNFRVVSRNGGFIQKKDATRDCLLGAGLCLGGILFVSATGEEYDDSNPPSGVYANVGSRYVDGGKGCLVASIWVGGLVFGIKGIIEIFSKDKRYTGMIDNWTTADILDQTSLVKLNEKQFELDGEASINQKVMPYLLVKTWL